MKTTLLSILSAGMIALSGNARAEGMPPGLYSQQALYKGDVINKVENTTLNVEIKVEKLTLINNDGKKESKTWAEYEIKNPSRNRVTRAIDIENDGIFDRAEVSALDPKKPYFEPFSISTAREMNYARAVLKEENGKGASGLYSTGAPSNVQRKAYDDIYDLLLKVK